ncbi:MAG TPA: cytochrome b N-terminal domain-containing protein [Pirellulaceae bacterium]|nr:cytochrome b N-terminal domain-containing protein [Pirellulaceae bacterium]
MIRSFLDWLDHRTGISHVVHDALYENIPSGARLRYITGSMLVFAFVVQAITGIFLAMAYSPSSQTAYESVFYIQHEMTGGWLVRGIHHIMAQAMVVVMALHLLQVIWDGAYRAPREVNYWLGLVLMQLVMGLGLTGYLLPWDQKGYWATNVATNLATLVPFVGKELQQLAVGGNEYGHHTLTRFYAMHMGVLPALLIIFLGLHVAMFRKHGIMPKVTPGRPDDYFWPKQVLFDAIGCLVLLVIVLLCVIQFDVVGLVQGKLDVATAGAELGAPADPAEQYSAARPEWYYLFLFQLLKYFEGTQEYIGALVIPGVVMTILALMPIVGRFQVGHWFNRAFIVFVLLGAGVLTGLAYAEDYFVYVARWMRWDSKKHPQWLFTRTHEGKEVDVFDKTLSSSQDFIKAREDAEKNAHRIVELVNRREVREEGELSDPLLVSRRGAVDLIRNDPLTQGPRLFGQHCASCHDYRDPADPKGEKGGVRFITTQAPQTAAKDKIKRDEAGNAAYDPPGLGAPNLYGFGTRQWIKGLLDPQQIVAVNFEKLPPASDPQLAAQQDHPDNHRRMVAAPYFGNTAHKEGRMAKWVEAHAELLKDDPQKADDDVDAMAAALSAQAQLRSQKEPDQTDAALIARGVGLLQKNCTNECHRFGDAGQLGLAPDLTGYGSYEWMLGMVSDPTHARFYRRENDRMPSFAADLDHPEKNSVSVRELSLIVDWLRGDYFRADDERPVLPHTEDEARLAVRASRTVAEPRTAVVGGLPPTEGQRAEELFARNCSACHSHADSGGRGIVAKNPTAPNLHGFASRAWLAGLFDPEQIAGDNYFGKTAHFEGDMVNFVKDNLTELDDENKAKRDSIIAALSAEAALPAQAELDKQSMEDGSLEKGKTALAEAWDATSTSCIDCHKYHDEGDLGGAPDLTGYGSQDWLVKMITDPTHEEMYRDTNDRMPSFGVDPPGAKQSLLTGEEIDLLARWLRGENLDAAAAK